MQYQAKVSAKDGPDVVYLAIAQGATPEAATLAAHTQLANQLNSEVDDVDWVAAVTPEEIPSYMVSMGFKYKVALTVA